MTNDEFKAKIAESPFADWYNSIEVVFELPYIGFKIELEGVNSIFTFINQQIEGWKIIDNLPNELKRSLDFFMDIRKSILNILINHPNDKNSSINLWNSSVKSKIDSVKNGQNFPLIFNCPQSIFLLNIYNTTPKYFPSAYNFLIIANSNYNPSDKNSLVGCIIAINYMLNNNPESPNRISSETEALTKLRNDFVNYLPEAERTLSTHMFNVSEKYKEYVQLIDKFKTEKESLFSSWYNGTKQEYSETQKKINDLEKTYQEKLKLEEPAKYWSSRAKRLKTQGWLAMGIVILLVLIACFSLGTILWKSPEQIYASWFGDDKSAAIRWSIVFITMLSFVAFSIRTVTKVMFSSFHLARDCEERYTLTYFYLSLIKDSKVDDKDRQLIMQSLFSRAETGLLKDDSSPTMPNDIISKVVTK